MKRTIVVCDRCRKQFKPKDESRTVELTWRDCVEVDLCEDCYNDLCKWLRNEED